VMLFMSREDLNKAVEAEVEKVLASRGVAPKPPTPPNVRECATDPGAMGWTELTRAGQGCLRTKGVDGREAVAVRSFNLGGGLFATNEAAEILLDVGLASALEQALTQVEAATLSQGMPSGRPHGAAWPEIQIFFRKEGAAPGQLARLRYSVHPTPSGQPFGLFTDPSTRVPAWRPALQFDPWRGIE
jgi:hypothetical protein